MNTYINHYSIIGRERRRAAMPITRVLLKQNYAAWELLFFALAAFCLSARAGADDSHSPLPVKVGEFEQQVHTAYTEADGLPSNDVHAIAQDGDGAIVVRTASGLAKFADGGWTKEEDSSAFSNTDWQTANWFPGLAQFVGNESAIREAAQHEGEYAVAAENGLFIGDGEHWTMALPHQGAIRWAPTDVRAAGYDGQGRLWFACPQGVGFRESANAWRLFTGADGLPFNDFTCMATGPKGVWFGTTNGAIRYVDGDFEFRQGRRWLLDNYVRGVVVDADGGAWFATSAGVSRIEFRPTTLADKATYFAEQIDKYHRRTRLGYVNPATLSTPGDKSTSVPEATDNDGHFGGLYLGAASLGYAATKREKLREDAVRAFEALAFLSKVTEGGTHPAPKGFIARAVAPTGEPNPNELEDAEYNQRRQKNDALWKLIEPRWPIDETGEWYWKCDSSSDELDGYYFGFGIYYDRVCKTEGEKDAVREVVRRITDHIIEHDYSLVDHDGKPTRWAHFSPDDLNRNSHWWVERGLNSSSILTYLTVAHHITGDQKYRDIFMTLATDEGYAMNLMTQPKVVLAPGAFGQADDNMAFMNYYHLVRYESDPKLLNMFQNAMYYHWRVEKYERNPFFNFVYAACNFGKSRIDQWGETDLSPYGPWLEDSIDTLKRYPLDLVDWPVSNAHRIDMAPLGDHTRDPGGGHLGAGHRNDGYVYRIDENHSIYWGDDPWALTHKADGTRLREGVSYLLAYYLGVVHGYIAG
ncbi:MAG: hypothetical protein HUU46_19410 [Candidatus Hydrogenedentes bacterium]|nr:hypothetical protein [Candidatus Hydrogenedentota bacterium]